MKICICISYFLFLISCNNSYNEVELKKAEVFKIVEIDTTIIDTNHKFLSEDKKLRVLILPPYDLNANRGISPNLDKYLELELSSDTNLILLNFPYKKFQNVAYQNIFDKKFCKPITDNLKVDIIIMSKLEQVTETGKMDLDKWNLSIRIYNRNTGLQINSKIKAKSKKDKEIKNLFTSEHSTLLTEIKNNR